MSKQLSGALISNCGLYRYRLWRIWDPHLPACAFVMLNPSTADADQDDPTIRRCIRFARDWGYGSLVVDNVFAYRATKPAEIRVQANPVGHENAAQLLGVGRSCTRVVAAWGTGVRWKGRPLADRAALVALRSDRVAAEPILCLGVTRNGFPRHPLYVRADQEPVPYGDAP